jgi:penicillin G amidase
MLKLIDKEGLTASQQEALNILSAWNYRFDADEVGASIFEIWQKDAYNRIWDEFLDPNLPMRLPNRDRTVQLLLHDPDSKWFDVASTPERENSSIILTRSFKFAIDSLQRKHGILGRNWRWAVVKNTQIPHLAKIPGFSSSIILNGGSKSAVNALNESNGPSWRMVVQLGNPTRGYGIFPGGQSGNPGSRFYDDQISIWAAGQLSRLLFLSSAKDRPKQITKQLTLTSN